MTSVLANHRSKCPSSCISKCPKANPDGGDNENVVGTVSLVALLVGICAYILARQLHLQILWLF